MLYRVYIIVDSCLLYCFCCAHFVSIRLFGRVQYVSKEMQNNKEVVKISVTENNGIYANKTAYMISNLGMTMTAMGISSEFKGQGIAANTIWPSTPIESFAVKNHKLGEKKMWRKSTELTIF